MYYRQQEGCIFVLGEADTPPQVYTHLLKGPKIVSKYFLTPPLAVLGGVYRGFVESCQGGVGRWIPSGVYPTPLNFLKEWIHHPSVNHCD